MWNGDGVGVLRVTQERVDTAGVGVSLGCSTVLWGLSCVTCHVLCHCVVGTLRFHVYGFFMVPSVAL